MRLCVPSPVNYLIVHGSYGNPEGNWFPWLKQQLESAGGKVFAPRFPTPDGQSLTRWRKIAEAALAHCLPRNTVLIGHSTGAIFVLRLAETTPEPFRAVYAVCPFARDLGLPEFDPLNATFINPPFDWKRTSRGARKIVCFAGNNDPYVPLACSQDIADNLDTQLIVVKKGGHLNAESGYHQFPLLLENIRKG